MIAGVSIIALGYFVPAFDQAMKDAKFHEFHFIGAVFAVLVIFLVVMGQVAPRKEAWVLETRTNIDMTPWKGLKWASAVAVIVVLTVYITFSK